MTLHCGSDEISDDVSSLATPDDAPESDHEADDEMNVSIIIITISSDTSSCT